MSIGKLYHSSEEQFLCNVTYQFQHETTNRWWGELIVNEYVRIDDGNSYVLELEDGRKSRCSLTKRVNRAVTGIPPRYIYRFAGNNPFA